MTYTALYRKYRPKNFDDVVGQNIVVKILKNSIINNKISHAYLFNGARGTGKTSIAKIFASAVNCANPIDGNACGKCEICSNIDLNDVDIIEIDAASNNGVEEIREIRSKVKLMPAVAKYKVYIIDEVHMLSIGAFNALLKTLEEPPKHVIFILATTEINKIPLTILSRCQRFDFGKIPDVDLISRLEYICAQESRKLSDNVIKVIAQLSDGGCRDAVNLLDQVLSLNNDNVTEEDIYNINGTISEKIIIDLFRSMYNDNLSEGLKIVDLLVAEGKNLVSVVDKLLIFVRNISVNLAIPDYFDKEKSDIYNEFQMSNEVIKKLSENLIELNNQLNKSINQKNLFEIYYIFLTEIINNGVKENKVINTNQNNINSKVKEINTEKKVKQNINIDTDVKNQNIDNNEIEDEKVSKENLSDKENCDIEMLKDIRINNVLATANKEQLQKILKDFDIINDFISNKVYNNIATLLLEGNVVVASNTYLMFSFSDDSLIPVFYHNINKVEQFLNEVFNNKYLVVAVSEKEWQKVRNKFVQDRKNNIEYKVIDEKPTVTYEKKHSRLENMAIDVFGKEFVESK